MGAGVSGCGEGTSGPGSRAGGTVWLGVRAGVVGETGAGVSLVAGEGTGTGAWPSGAGVQLATSTTSRTKRIPIPFIFMSIVHNVLVQSFSDKSMLPKCYNSPQFLSSHCLRCRFGSSFTPPQNWGSALESNFFLASVHLLSPGGCFPQFDLSLSQ